VLYDDDFHSKTCTGLSIEHRSMQEHVDQLQNAVRTEMVALPTTVDQVFKRLGGMPEQGTASYPELMAERDRLKKNEDAAARINCPAQIQAALHQQ